MKKKVLIIDDNLNVCREIKYALQNVTTRERRYERTIKRKATHGCLEVPIGVSAAT